MSFMSPGNVVWFEIGTAEPQKVQDFYGPVLGWTFTVDPDSSVDGRTYTRIMARGAPWPMGAVQQGGTGGEDINLSVLSADVLADVERLAALGAKVLVPATRVGAVTDFARLADRLGNTFSLFSQGASADLANRQKATEQHLEQTSFAPRPGTMAGFVIAASDSGTTRAFCAAAFWRFAPHPAAPGTYLMFTRNPHRSAARAPRPGAAPGAARPTARPSTGGRRAPIRRSPIPRPAAGRWRRQS